MYTYACMAMRESVDISDNHIMLITMATILVSLLPQFSKYRVYCLWELITWILINDTLMHKDSQ